MRASTRRPTRPEHVSSMPPATIAVAPAVALTTTRTMRGKLVVMAKTANTRLTPTATNTISQFQLTPKAVMRADPAMNPTDPMVNTTATS